MRMFIALSAVALAAAVPVAGAAPGASLSVKASAGSVLFGKPVTLSGRLSGVSASTPIQVLAWRYGASSPSVVSAVIARTSTHYTAKVRPQILTLYKLRVGRVLSSGVRVSVHPALALHELGDGRIWAHAAAGRSLKGHSVQVQMLRSGAWQTIRRGTLDSAGSRLFAPLPGDSSGQLRLAISVNEAGAGYLGSTSHALAYHALALSLQPSQFKVLYGHAVTIGGRLWSGQAGQAVTIEAWPFKASSPRRIATVTTRANGAWSLEVQPTARTVYQAIWTLHKSARVAVGVAPAISIQKLSGRRIAVTVRAGRSFVGRQVKLQQQVAPGVWHTVQQIELGRGSHGVFHVVPALPTSTVRVAMSVNEAGAGYLGSFSRTMRYQP